MHGSTRMPTMPKGGGTSWVPPPFTSRRQTRQLQPLVEPQPSQM